MIEVAEPILRYAQTLSYADLDAVVRDFGPAHATVIAARREAVPERSAPPIVTQPPAQHIAQNRPDQNAELSLADLFFSAESAERRMLLMSLGSVEAEKPQSVQPVETNRALEAAALGRNRAEFTTLLQNALGLTVEQAERVISDPSGEPLLVAGKALAMPSVTIQRILMFVDPAIGESVQRFFDLAGFYERLSADAAHKIVASIRGHEPVRARRAPPARASPDVLRRRGGALDAAAARSAVPPRPSSRHPARIETGVRQRTM